jgi:hypothetical protein
MQSCFVTSSALPMLDATLISPIGPYSTQFSVFAASATSLLPIFASPDDNAAATVRIGQSTCKIISASSPIPHAGLNDFGSQGGYLQILQLKTFSPELMISDTYGSFTKQAISDVAVSAAGSVVTTLSAAISKLLQVQRNRTFSSHYFSIVCNACFAGLDQVCSEAIVCGVQRKRFHRSTRGVIAPF